MKKQILLVTAVILSSYLQAQQDSTKNLDELVVTATKKDLPQSQTGKVVTVIDQLALQRAGGRSLTELLNQQAGLYVIGANNTLGTNQDIYLRGSATGNTLILVDGIPVADPSQINNSFDLNTISPGQIERIEILKGSQSTLWGSDAVAGVINIITKKGGMGRVKPFAGISYGSYQTFMGAAGLNGQLGKFNYNLHYNHTSSKGFSSAYDSTHRNDFDKDGFRQDNLQVNLGYQLTQKLSITSMTNFGVYKTDLDAGAFSDDKDYTGENTNSLNSVSLVYKTNKSALHFTNTILHAKRTLNDDSASIGGFSRYVRALYKGYSFISELTGNHSFTDRLSIVAGVQRLAQNTEQSFYSISDFGPFESSLDKDLAAITNYAIYASLTVVNLEGFNAEAGIRYNHHSIYGNNTTYSFNPSYNIDENTRVFVNISSAFKMPSLYQLYSEYGNTGLQPEESNNYEAGVQSLSSDKRNSLRIVGFKRNIRHLIIFYSDPVTYASQYINRDKQHDYGFEVESNLAIGKVGNWLTNITYVDGEGDNGDAKFKNFYRRPNFTFNSSISLYPAKELTITPSLRVVGSRLKGEFDAGPNEMPAYYTVDFYTGYRFSKQFRAFIDLRNLTNQEYFDVVGYNSRKFNVMAGVVYGL